MAPFQIRKAIPDDAAGITEVLTAVTRERIHSAILQAWPVKKQREYIENQPPREAIFVAVAGDDEIVGCQFLDQYSAILPSMAHVASIGSFVKPAFRGHRIASQLWRATKTYAVVNGYKKAVIQVRASNAAAQNFYKRLGFAECGRLKDQVVIDGAPDDEIVFEAFF